MFRIISAIIFFSINISCVTTFAHPGIGIAEDSRGNIFYTDLFKVWKITPDGKKSVAVPNVHTHELFLDEDDNFFGEHLWYNGEAKNTWGHDLKKVDNQGKTSRLGEATHGSYPGAPTG